MIVTLNDISRRFNYDWIFRNISYTFSAGNAYAIIGPNGSGKSTLLRIVAGQLTPSGGNTSYAVDGNNIPAEMIFHHVSYAAPYLDIMDEFTLEESLHFQAQFKPWIQALSTEAIIRRTGLEKHRHKQLKHYSSGMKQRVKLVMAICARSTMVLLDEPTTNLDKQGTQWYLDLIQEFAPGRIILVGSNQEKEYAFCTQYLNIADYK